MKLCFSFIYSVVVLYFDTHFGVHDMLVSMK